MNSLSKLYSNYRIKLYELKKVNANVNFLLGHMYLLIYNKKRNKESIIENAKVSENIKKYVKFIDLKFVKVVNIEENLYETIDIIHNKFKNKQCYGILNEFNKITIYIIKSLRKKEKKKSLVIILLLKRYLLIIVLIKKSMKMVLIKKSMIIVLIKKVNDNSTNKKINDNSTNKINIYLIIVLEKEKNMMIVLLKKIYMKVQK